MTRALKPRRVADLPRRGKRRADVGFSPAFPALPQEGSPSLASWWPRLQSADGANLPRRDETVARIRELASENGYLSGAVQRAVDEAIGANFLLNWRPDLKALGLDAEWGKTWISATERAFRNYCADPRRPLDAAGRLDLSGLFGVAFRHPHGGRRNHGPAAVVAGARRALFYVGSDGQPGPSVQPDRRGEHRHPPRRCGDGRLRQASGLPLPRRAPDRPLGHGGCGDVASRAGAHGLGPPAGSALLRAHVGGPDPRHGFSSVPPWKS